MVISRILEEHIINLKEIFLRLLKANMRLNIDKCEFFEQKFRYLEHITKDGIKTDPDQIDNIKLLPTPKNLRELRRCPGIASLYCRLIPDFSKITQPLTSLIKKGKHWSWGSDQKVAFQTLDDKLSQASILAYLECAERFYLQINASEQGVGAEPTKTIMGT